MVTTTTLPTLVRVTRSRERPEKVVTRTREKAQLARSGDFERAVGAQDGTGLDKAFQQYLEYRTVKEPIMEDNRWRNVLRLQTLLSRPEYARISLAGREHALYEELHRSNPERFVSKSRFMVIMRRVFGFELAPVRGAVDADVKELVEDVFDAFDERQNDKMEWRGILLMLHVVMKPSLPPVEHFKWGFALTGSEGSFDITCGEPFDVRLASLKHMLFTLGHVKSRPMLTLMVDDTWATMCRQDPRAAALTRNAETRKLLQAASGKKDAARLGGAMNDNEEMNVADGVKLTLPMFERLLETPPLADMLGRGTVFGSQDPRTWTYLIEEEQYHPLIFAEIRRQRLHLRHEEAVREFRKKHRFREKRRVRAWHDVAHRIRHLKEFVLDALYSGAARRMRVCFLRWHYAVLLVIRVHEVQRVARGFLGRLDARWITRVHDLVIEMQAKVRKFLVLVSTRRELRRRRWAATEIERHARALNARRLAMWRLEDKIDRERRELERRKVEWRTRRERYAARTIQGAWRKRVAREAALAERRRREDAIVTVRDMERLHADNVRRRKIYEVQLEEWYAEQKKEHEMNTMYEDFGANERAKILHYRRKQMYNAEKEKEKRAAQLQEMLEDERVANWIRKWEIIKEERVKELRTRLEWCRTTPETAEERAVGRTLQQEAKKRAKLVLRRAFKAGVPMELPEAEAFALEEVLLKRCRDEERQVDVERTLAADTHYAAIANAEREEREERERNIERVQNNASRAIQKQWELHLARLEIRKRAMERFEKCYDIDLRAFYYRDKATAVPQWRKPYALGAFDLKLKDEWVVLHDETRVPYYYNPQSQEMSWGRPVGTVFCAACDENFCAVYCNVLEQRLCMACYDAKHGDLDEAAFNDLTFKLLPGGDPESGRADIEALEDTGKRLEEERQKQEELDRVARRQSLRRQSTVTRQSAVGAELAKLKNRMSVAAGRPESEALANILTTMAEPEETEEQLERTQRETSELMTIVEERARQRARRDSKEDDEDPWGKRPMVEYRRQLRRPSELLRIANGDQDDAARSGADGGADDKSAVASTITRDESLEPPSDSLGGGSLASSLLEVLDSAGTYPPDPPDG